MMYITKRMEFCAAHRLQASQKTDQENAALFGKCFNAPGHGHNYTLEVTLGGAVDPETGMVFDLKELKDIIEHEIIAKVDHQDLNAPDGLLGGLNPTTEHLALKIWDVLLTKLGPSLLKEVKLWETPNNAVSYRGETS